MSLKKNTRPIAQHAFLSPSSYHWINDNEDELKRRYYQKQQAVRGDKLHALAHQAIELGVKQAENGTTLSMYVNDAIGFRMESEVQLYYTEDCYGTTDTACFRDNVLRIHDLKTGTIVASMMQLKIYAAIFCLQYGMSPLNIEIRLRIYQNDDITEEIADPAEMLMIISQIKAAAYMIARLREED